MNYWNNINSITELKSLQTKELKTYADEIRRHIISVVKDNGGHLASNLGAVELTVALHYVFNTPADKIVFDVGHQSYTHKILTGRKDRFTSLRKSGGITGFPKPSESEHDVLCTGHSSTSLSVALGLAHARELRGGDYNVIAVIGDGALTGGLALEALNDIGASQSRVIIILNDNKMSISKNVGAMSNYLAKLRLSKRYAKLKYNIKKAVQALPFFGDSLVRFLDRAKENLKSALISNKIFENFGIKYYGPFDGHNIESMVNLFSQVQQEKRPVIIHLVTEKGRGYPDAVENPSKFHGMNPSGECTAQAQSFSSIAGEKLAEMAIRDQDVVAITAAMGSGTGLDKFSQTFPQRYFDVGIAEEHAVTMAAGMAKNGLKPYFAVYSTFLQRSFDEILHDVCLNDLPVKFLIDRAGIIGADGVTHQGIFDISYLNIIPNLTVLTPADGKELEKMMEASLAFPHPLAIRYPKSFNCSYIFNESSDVFKWEYVQRAEKSKIYLLAAGNRMLDLASSCGEDINIVNCRCVKPLDFEFLSKIDHLENRFVTLEDNVLTGGFGQSVKCRCGAKAEVYTMAHKDEFIDELEMCSSFEKSGLSRANLLELLNNLKK